MWDPEYCDSRLRAVEASGESRELSETQSQADAWYTCDQFLAVAQRCYGQEMLLGLPILCSTSSRPQMSCRIPLVAVLSIQLGSSF